MGRYRGDIGAAAVRLLRLGLSTRDALIRLLLGCWRARVRVRARARARARNPNALALNAGQG